MNDTSDDTSQDTIDYVLPDLCDAYEDAVEVVDEVFSSYGGRRAFGGPVRTVRCFEDNSRVREMVGEAGEGAVLVVDGGASRRCALLGDNLAEMAVDNGWSGILVWGCVRDVEALGALRLGVQALGTHPRKSVKRGAGDVDVPVRFGGVTFAPGRWVYADRNGVIVADQALEMPA